MTVATKSPMPLIIHIVKSAKFCSIGTRELNDVYVIGVERKFTILLLQTLSQVQGFLQIMRDPKTLLSFGRLDIRLEQI